MGTFIIQAKRNDQKFLFCQQNKDIFNFNLLIEHRNTDRELIGTNY